MQNEHRNRRQQHCGTIDFVGSVLSDCVTLAAASSSVVIPAFLVSSLPKVEGLD